MAAQAHYVLNLPRGIHLHTQTLQLPMPTSSHEATFQCPAKPAGRSITISVYKVLIKTVGIEKKSSSNYSTTRSSASVQCRRKPLQHRNTLLRDLIRHLRAVGGCTSSLGIDLSLACAEDGIGEDLAESH